MEMLVITMRQINSSGILRAFAFALTDISFVIYHFEFTNNKYIQILNNIKIASEIIKYIYPYMDDMDIRKSDSTTEEKTFYFSFRPHSGRSISFSNFEDSRMSKCI